jgi:hypothetical protein
MPSKLLILILKSAKNAAFILMWKIMPSGCAVFAAIDFDAPVRLTTRYRQKRTGPSGPAELALAEQAHLRRLPFLEFLPREERIAVYCIVKKDAARGQGTPHPFKPT